jgi:hypothetical protein
VHQQTADGATLTQAHRLAVADTLHASTADGPALTQQHTLAVADAQHAQRADDVNLITEGSVTLVVDDARHSMSSAHVGRMVQNSTLLVDDARHSTTSDGALAVIQDFTLIVSDARHLQTADGPALQQAHQLAVSDTRHEQAATGPALVQQHYLTVDECTHAQRAGVVTIPIYFYWLAIDRTVLTRKAAARSCTTAHQYSSVLLTRGAWASEVPTQLTTDKQILTRYEILR